ncbi:hypothetical protein AAW01_07500 [Aurantiacibacter gangjinensis]|uniref:Glycosyltransferase n=1 Tax=Aurantiacibacter gangjinensis TaxID=502682 RepID=A0A0G9ML23_9SPHN|nr:hypothetical protein AAW01_07500 [Aurantiacibacter gangjinensis]
MRGAIAPPPIDDVVLADYRMERDDSAEPRLSFVLPNLAQSELYGGISTGIDLTLRLLQKLAPGVSLRVILANPTMQSDFDIFDKAAAAADISEHRIEHFAIRGNDAVIPVRRREMFLTYNWWTTLNISPLLRQQATEFETQPKPLIYLVQDYEPHMMPFSSALNLAREALDSPDRLWRIFNSKNLQAYTCLQGHTAERDFVFEPVMNEALRPALAQAAGATRERRILIYGRPSIARNCFPALVRGLRAWARDCPGSDRWEIASAGAAHADIELGNGKRIQSLGKLTLEDYARVLLQSSVGVSLMSSPHPSYPPLEMANFGLRTITNRFTCKSWENGHPNIFPVDSIQADPLSRAIAQACDMWPEAPVLAPDPTFTRDDAYPFMPELAEAVSAQLA